MLISKLQKQEKGELGRLSKPQIPTDIVICSVNLSGFQVKRRIIKQLQEIYCP